MKTKKQQSIKNESEVYSAKKYLSKIDIIEYNKLEEFVKRYIVTSDEQGTLGGHYAHGFAVIDGNLYDVHNAEHKKYRQPTLVRLRHFTMQFPKKEVRI